MSGLKNSQEKSRKGRARQGIRGQKIKLIALDLDGTTLTRGHITKRTRKALEEAICRGIEVVIATGRVYSALPKDVFRIRGLRYVMNSNGAVITDLTREEVVYENYIDSSAMERVLTVLRQKHHPIEVFTGGKAYIDELVYEDLKKKDSEYAKYMSREYVLRTRQAVPGIFDFLADHMDRIENINVEFGVQAEKREMRALLEEIEGVTITSSMPHNLEIGGKTTSKASGLAHLCSLIGIDMEQAMACGDSPNDMAMLREVGLSVAMESGEQEVKDMADYVAPPNEEEGVAFAVEKLALGYERPGWQLALLRVQNRAAGRARKLAVKLKKKMKGRP